MPSKPKTSKQNLSPAVTKARRWFYSNKIINLFWFEGELPKDLEREFSYLINPDWPDGPLLPESFRGIMDLNESELQYICKRMKKPEWARERHAIRGKTCLQKMDESWPLPPDQNPSTAARND